jgi:hypothetical protein
MIVWCVKTMSMTVLTTVIVRFFNTICLQLDRLLNSLSTVCSPTSPSLIAFATSAGVVLIIDAKLRRRQVSPAILSRILHHTKGIAATVSTSTGGAVVRSLLWSEDVSSPPVTDNRSHRVSALHFNSRHMTVVLSTFHHSHLHHRSHSSSPSHTKQSSNAPTH